MERGFCVQLFLLSSKYNTAAKKSLVQSTMTEFAFVLRCSLISREFAEGEEWKRQVINWINYK